MNSFIDYFFGTIAVIIVTVALIFMASVAATVVVLGFMLLPAFMQVPCVCAVLIGVVLLVTVTIYSICTCKKYAKAIKQIDRNPNTPSAYDQVEDYSLKSLVKEIV